MILSSLANMFLFNKGVNLSIKKRAYLKKVCGSHLISSLGRTSVTAYLWLYLLSCLYGIYLIYAIYVCIYLCIY